MSVLAAISAGANALGAVGSTVGAFMNYNAEKNNLAWQKSAYKDAKNREDTAVQRRAADLEAAGLSKTLAAGSAATTMAPIRTEAPQIDTTAATAGFRGISEAAQNYIAITAQKAQIDKTVQENKLLRLQQDKQELENAFMTQANPLNLQGIKQEIEFARLANPQRLARLAAENEGIGLENKNRQLDSRLKLLGIDRATVDLVGAKITNEAKTLGLDQQRQDIIAKQLAIETAQLNLDNAKYDTEWYHKLNLPKDFQFGPVSREAAVAAHGIEKGVENTYKRAMGSTFENMFRR